MLSEANMKLYGLAITVFATWAMFHALGIDPARLLTVLH